MAVENGAITPANDLLSDSVDQAKLFLNSPLAG
jgi:hypothetical protein